MGYTSQTLADQKLIESILAEYAGREMKFLEIGTYQGDTAREIKAFCERQGTKLEYWGIDYGVHPTFVDTKSVPPIPFHGANMIFGDSSEVFHLAPNQIDVVLCDACHCINHVILDTLHYGARVTAGGYMLFHDTAPHIQQTMRDPHGPDIPEFRNSVLAAHKLMGFPFLPWRFHSESVDLNAPWGGITCYRKL